METELKTATRKSVRWKIFVILTADNEVYNL